MAVLLSVGLAAAGAAARRVGREGWTNAAAFATEASLVAGLYSVWQLINTFTHTAVTGASDRAMWIWKFERSLWLPNELSLQRVVLGNRLLVEACNGFYAIVHVPALGIFLVWMFARHRDRYPEYRNILALLTLVSLLIHLIAVAPPRLLAGTGFVDTGLLYHQSVYGPVGTGISDQVSAMPSLHLAWACLIALAVVHVGRGGRRWLILLHPVLTMIVVVVTGNHFWLDGIAAAGLLAVCFLVVNAARLLSPRRRQPEPALRQRSFQHA
jgi:hypothetical protein